MTRDAAVWITGIGTANPVGMSYTETARNLISGRSGVRPIKRFDTQFLSSRIGGEIGVTPVPRGWHIAAFAELERLDQLAMWCSVEALQDAGRFDSRTSTRMGIVLGNGGEWLRLWEADKLAGGNRLHDPSLDTETTVQGLQRRLELTGPAVTVAAACASGNYALAEARNWIRNGWVDICLAGAVDMTVSPLGVAAFGNLRALSRRNDAPQQASRPFDKNRDGFVMSEGGAMFLLESAESARRRGAKGYAEIAGFGASSDAFHLVIPGSDPAPAAAAMRTAFADAKINADQVDYINAHATSTPIGDPGEVRSIKLALGEAVSQVAVSSTKGTTGHVLCAAAAVEAIACIAAFEQQIVPPTINLEELDPDCAGLCHVANTAQERKVAVAVSNSFGFGGSNTSLVLRKVA